MHENIYQNLSEVLKTTISPLLESQAKITDSIIKSTNKLANELTAIVSQNMVIEFEQLSELCNALVSAIEFPPLKLPDIGFLKDFNFQKGYVNLTEDECDSINSLLDSSAPFDVSSNTQPKISKGKINVPDFIKSILLPILIALIQMMYTSYCSKLDTIESQKAHMEERQLKEDEIQLLEKQIQLQEQELQAITNYAESLEDSLNELIDYVNPQMNPQEIQESDFVAVPDQETSDEAPKSLGVIPNYSGVIADEYNTP